MMQSFVKKKMQKSETEQMFIESQAEMLEAMHIVSPRCDIYQDHIIYALCKAVWRILVYLTRNLEKERMSRVDLK